MLKPERGLRRTADALIAYLRREFSSSGIEYATELTQMQGGQEAYTYRFRLRNASEALSKSLVLRLYPSFQNSRRVLLESTVQNLLFDVQYPAPRVYATCADKAILGGAFFLMEYLPGETMLSAPPENVAKLLAASHAALHNIDPTSLNIPVTLASYENRVEGRLDGLFQCQTKYPWLRESLQWLAENRPEEPERLSVCHGDFHPSNILVDNDNVTGVLDWPGFLIADPVLDVAFTIVCLTIPFRRIFPQIEWNYLARGYLENYQIRRAFDLRDLAYYRVLRCVTALVDAADGQVVWRDPFIVKDLTEYIHSQTGISVASPHYA
jgi:aminoglycoside phosphotransferase (APT) family kinase protein